MRPVFLYGTAWKENDTQHLTELALEVGFRGIDTANQRKHYVEEAVGRGVQAAIARGALKRDDLFWQTKFTFQRGQDARLPYDPRAPIALQVEQSFASSQQHLGVGVIDSYVLHGPTFGVGLVENDWEAWGAMERLVTAGEVRALGISNVTAEQLETLVAKAKVKPSFVQNRCYASRGWDAGVRAVCQAHGVTYQGFSLLTANPAVLGSALVVEIARREKLSAAQVVFAAAIGLGILPLTGTSNRAHMAADLSAANIRLSGDELQQFEQAVVSL